MTLNVNDAIKNRRATRKYTDQEITDEVLDRVVNLALEAPSAFNAQRADLVVVRDQAVKDAIFAASGQAQHRDAPVVLVTIARTGKPTDLTEILGPDRAAYADENFFGVLDAAGLRETAMKDAMLVSGFALLAAQSEGLGTSPTTPLNEAGVLKAVEAFLEKIDQSLLGKLADIPGFDKVLEDMAQQGGKFVGGRFLLEYFAKLADQFDDLAFEVSTALVVNGRNVGRIYDAVVHIGGREIRFELKCWSNWAHWSDGAFRGQFLKDLASMAKGNPVKWVFDGSKLDRVTVKRRALEAMREPGFRREVDGILEDQIAREKLRQILKRESKDSGQLLEALENDQVFDIISRCDMGVLALLGYNGLGTAHC